MTSLPNNLYTCEQTRELDRIAIEKYGIAGITLMKRAARAAFQQSRNQWPQIRDWIILCGSGNNAGDGYVFAALAQQAGHRAQVFYVVEPEKLKGDAQRAYQYALQEGASVEPFDQESLQSLLDENCVIVDALLGTGISGAVREEYAQAISWVNQSGLPAVALDIPSGLCGDTGQVLGTCVRADISVTFIAIKTGLLVGQGPVYSGHLHYCDLDVPAELFQSIEPRAYQAQRGLLKECLPERTLDLHKGQLGQVMIVGGDHGFGGAAILACEAAAFAGAGLISLATQAAHVSAVLVRRPEVMAAGVPSGQELEPLLKRPSVLVVGPGLGQSAWSEQMLQQSLLANLPMVLDADALNILAKGRLKLPEEQSGQWVLTPHPGEAARLLNVSVETIQQDRLSAARNIQQKFGGVVVLKGLGTIIDDGEQTVVAKVGNPGLARGGSGDVLSGVIGSLIAQQLPLFEAAQLAVCAHGDAADLLAEESGELGMLPSELAPYIRECLQ